MTAFAAPEDVADLWRPLSVAEAVATGALLDRVSALIRLRRPTIDARLAAEPNLALVARGVAVDAVLRVLRNPDGLTFEQIGAYAYRRADAVADGVLYVTDREWSLLETTATGYRGGAFTIRPGANR